MDQKIGTNFADFPFVSLTKKSKNHFLPKQTNPTKTHSFLQYFIMSSFITQFYKFFSILAAVVLSLTLTFSLVGSVNGYANRTQGIKGLPNAEEVCNDGGQKGNCGFVQKSDNIASLAANIAQIMTYIIGSIAIVFILYGAFQWMIDPEKGAATGKKIIVNALIALVISVAAYGLVSTVLNFLNTNSVGDGTGTSQTGANNGANNNANPTKPANTGTNYNNQTNSQNKPEKVQNPPTNQPIQQNNPQNFNNSQNQTNQNNNPKPVVNSTPKNDNQTNPTLEFAFPEIKTPQAPAIQ